MSTTMAPERPVAAFAEPAEVTATDLANSLTDILPVELPPRYDGSPITHLSASSINEFLLCPEAWRRRRLQGIKHPPTPAMFMGRVFDETLNTVMRQHIEHGAFPDTDEILQVILPDHFQGELDDAAGAVAWEPGFGVDECRTITRSAVAIGIERLLPVIGTPVSVQRQITPIRLHPSLRWTVVGTMDLESIYRVVKAYDDGGELIGHWVADQPEPTVNVEVYGQLRSPRHTKFPLRADVPVSEIAALLREQEVRGIDDAKLKDTAIDKSKADSDIQAGLYLTANWLAGTPADQFRWLQALKPGAKRQEASTAIITTTRSDAQMRALMVRVADVAAHIVDLYNTRGPDRLWPLALPGSWKCSQRYCDHYRQRTCPMAGI